MEYLMYGKHPVLSALSNPLRKIKKIYCNVQIYNKYHALIKNFKYEVHDNDFLDKKIGKNKLHQGIISLVETVYIYSNNIIVTTKCSRIVILDRMQDSQNIGAIIRSGVAFGVDVFICTVHDSPSENGDIDKASAGSIELAKIFMVKNLRNVVYRLKKLGFWVVGLDANSKDSIKSVPSLEKIAVVVGSESRGIRRIVLDNCDFRAKIPIQSVESLNASNAAAIAFYSMF